MKTPKTILKDAVTDFLNGQSKVTYVGKDSVIRALLHSVAYVVGELWNDVYQVKRQSHAQTAEGASLDTIAERHGITRKTAQNSSVVLLFNGTAGTVIPLGTVVKNSISGAEYQTMTQITLGARNGNLVRPVNSNSLGDAVIAESRGTGSITASSPNELTILATPIAGVTVTNLAPSKGGADAESDSELRERILSQVALLNLGTNAFYQVLAKEADNTVLRAKPQYNPTNGGVDLYLLKDSGADYTAQELTDIKNYVYANQRALQPVACYNVTKKAVEVEFLYSRNTAFTQAEAFRNVAIALSNFIDANTIDFGAVLEYSDLLNVCLNADGIDEIKITSFKVNGAKSNVTMGNTELPRFTQLSINDSLNTAIETIEQVYFAE